MKEDATVGPHADVVLYAPSDELVESDMVLDELRAHPTPNPASAAYRPGVKPPKRRRRQRTLEHAALELYGGNEGLLVRTALIRSEKWGNKKLPKVSSDAEVAELCRHLTYADSEYMVTLALAPDNSVRAIHEAAVGPASNVAFTPQQVLKVAFLTHSTAMIMVHNHPSGDPTPSREDIATTNAMGRAAQCVGIELLDHVIVAQDGFVSLRTVGDNFPFMSYVKDKSQVGKWSA